MLTERKCSKCGETNEDKFYGNRKTLCGKCHNKYTIEKGRGKKDFIVNVEK